MDVPPLFVVGSPRSGTSILMEGLLTAGYNGFLEGNFLSMIRMLERTVDRHFNLFGTTNSRVLISLIDQADLKKELIDAVVRRFKANCPPEPWVDKTGNPEMIEAMPLLRELWPEAKFIFAKRRAIENLVSRVQKFPGHDFGYHCRDWARNMAAWRHMCGRYADLPGIEVDQRDISDSPAATADLIAGFLGMPDEARAKLAGTFQNRRPQQTGPDTTSRVLSLAETGWSDEQLEKFHRLCDREMNAYGYTEDKTYRSEEARNRGGSRIVVDRDTTDDLELELADTPRIKGVIGIFRPSEIKGWAFDPALPDEHLRVEVVSNGRSVATTQANLFRKDLQAAGFGNGFHAFELVLREKLPTDQPDAVKVYAHSSSGRRARLPLRQPPPS